VRSLALDPADSSRVYAGYATNGSGGILKSVDAGQSWTVLYTADGAGSISVVAGPRGLYAAGLRDGGLLKSADGGATWNPANTGLDYFYLTLLAMDPVRPGTIYTGGLGGLFRSVDGANWTNLNSPRIAAESQFGFPGSDSVIRSLVVDYTNPDVLYVNTVRGNGCVFNDKVVFKTTDGGVSWSDSVSPPESGCLLGGYFAPPTPVMLMDPSDSQTLYLGENDDDDGNYALLKSVDGGASWQSVWDHGPQSSLNTVLIDRRNPATLYAGVGDAGSTAGSSEIGFFKTDDGGATWKNIGLKNTAVTVLAIDPTNPETFYAATQGIYTDPRGFRGLFKSADAGETWSPVSNGLEALIQVGAAITALGVDPNRRNIVYAATSGDGVYRTLDAGANWAKLNDGLANLDVRAMATAPGVVYVATAGGVFKLPTDSPQ
jgi:photosystem II stability/assembly factor-like uncharacterized protein